jgi:hypothetical protein
MGRLAYDVTAVTGKVKGHHTGPGMNMMTYIYGLGTGRHRWSWIGAWYRQPELRQDPGLTGHRSRFAGDSDAAGQQDMAWVWEWIMMNDDVRR